MCPSSENTDHHQELSIAIWQIVASISYGKVATYGQVAKQAGYPNHARAVGAILKKLPSNTQLPWHRVINAKGQLSFPLESPAYIRQKQRLESEGVEFQGSKISLSRYRCF